MLISVETPVFKGGWLERCIDSVLYQSSPSWRFSLLWDGGDEASRRILEALDRRNHPQVTVRFSENRGIARARREITQNSEGDFILPLDDDDVLPFYAVERLLEIAEQKPWASVIRARRKFIDEEGKVVDAPPWFPFEARHYQHGMVTDLFNHSQPYLIRRSAYEQTSGWEGFEDFRYAGEDCDIYLKLEEVGSVELVDETLYYYRINPDRASLVLTDEAAFEMWRRLADKTVARIGLPLRRVNERLPFQYERLPRPEPALDSVDFVVVVEESATRLESRRAAKSLRRSGVSDDALHVVVRENPGYLNAALRQTTRPLVCFVHADLDVEGADRLQALLRAMAEQDADLAAPRLETEDGFMVFANPGFDADRRPVKTGEGEWNEGQYDELGRASWLTERLVLVRREVAQAVGGFDEGYAHDRMAMMDFCLKVRQRDFDCVYLGSVCFTQSGPDPALDLEADLRRLQEKWAGLPGLFEGAREASTALPG
jgi:glycosyltransferase involved in cell wall biosynthesis